MKKFKFPVVMKVVISIAFVLQSLILNSVYAQSHYPIEVKNQPVQVRISQLKIKSGIENDNNEDKVLSGLVKRRSYNSHVLPGHIDYVIFDSNDDVTHEGAIQVSGLNLRNSRYGRQFKILLPKNMPEGSHIKIGWHKNQTSAFYNASISHKSNSLL